MKNVFLKFCNRLILMSAVAVLFVFAGCGDDDEEFVPTQTLAEILEEDEDLTQLEAFIAANANLQALLEAEGDKTFFAPTNDAFDNLKEILGEDDLSVINPQIISAVLAFHIVNGESLMSGEISGNSYTTVQGEDVTINSNGTIFHGGSNEAVEIVEPNIQATNGVMHKVGTILIPPSLFAQIGQVLGTTAQPLLLGAPFTDYASIIKKADESVPSGEMSIAQMLGDRTNTSTTVFAQTNDAFTAVAGAAGVTKEQLLASYTSSPAVARAYMLRHISTTNRLDGEEVVAGATITMDSGTTQTVAPTTQSASAPLGLVLVPDNGGDPSALFALDVAEGSNGIIHVSSPVN